MALQVPEMFADYERDYARNRQELDDRLRAAEALLADAAQKSLSEAAQRAVRADSALKQMEMEARSLPAETRAALSPKLRKYREELVERRKAVEEAQRAASRRALLGDRRDEDLEKGSLGKSVRDRERLLGATDGLDQATKRLEQATREALETERIGIDVMSDLRQQREIILSIGANVGEVSENTGVAKKLLDSMMRRAMMNRMVTYVAVGVVALALIGAVYFTLVDRSNADTMPVAESEPRASLTAESAGLHTAVGTVNASLAQIIEFTNSSGS